MKNDVRPEIKIILILFINLLKILFTYFCLNSEIFNSKDQL